MANKHIKTIKGKQYYYESIRRGKKVTSRYIGPVEERVKTRKKEAVKLEDIETPEDSYIG